LKIEIVGKRAKTYIFYLAPHSNGKKFINIQVIINFTLPEPFIQCPKLKKKNLKFSKYFFLGGGILLIVSIF